MLRLAQDLLVADELPRVAEPTHFGPGLLGRLEIENDASDREPERRRHAHVFRLAISKRYFKCLAQVAGRGGLVGASRPVDKKEAAGLRRADTQLVEAHPRLQRGAERPGGTEEIDAAVARLELGN